MKKMRRILAGIMTVSLCACLVGCNGISLGAKEEEPEEEKKVKVRTELPKTDSIYVNGDFIGSVESEEQIFVMSKAAGDVTDTFFEVGDRVNEGDLMFTVDDTSAQIAMKQASAALSTANASLNTAQAGVNTANASVNATQASVMENFAKAGTTDQQFDVSIHSSEISFQNAETNIGQLEHQVDKLNETIDGINDLRDSIAKLKSEYEMASSQDKPIIEERIKASETQLKAMGSEDSYKEQIRSLEANIEVAKRSNCLNVENANLTRQQKSDYDNYTKATIGNGGILSLTQAQAGVVQAQAGVVQSRAGISQAQAGVDAAQLQLDNTRVVAPVSGIVTAKNVTKNNMTTAGNVAYTIMSDGTKYVTFYVSEVVMYEIYEGQNMVIDKNGVFYDAVVTENARVADSQNGLFKIKAKIIGGEDIINGIKVKITLVTDHSDNVITLPIDAVYHESERSYVYTAENGKAEKKFVETGLFDDEKIEIISGITTDDNVIVTWSSQLRDGVEIEEEKTSSQSNNSTSDDIFVERN